MVEFVFDMGAVPARPTEKTKRARKKKAPVLASERAAPRRRRKVTADEAREVLQDPIKFELLRQQWKRAIEARMAPAGALGLPALLDKRRLEYGIIDAAFRIQALYERIFIWQIPDVMDEMETAGQDSAIITTDIYKQRAQESAPRGIIISAGLKALDVLHSNGSGLGDIISLQYLAPFRRPIDRIDGKDVYMVVLNVGDLVGSEDVRMRIVDGSVELKRQSDAGHIKHAYVNKETGEMWHPEVPWASAAY